MAKMSSLPEKGARQHLASERVSASGYASAAADCQRIWDAVTTTHGPQGASQKCKCHKMGV